MADEQVVPMEEQAVAPPEVTTPEVPAEPVEEQPSARTVPYDRFEEVIRDRQQLAAQIEMMREMMERTRQPAPPPVEDDLDPAELALRETRQLREEMASTKDHMARQAASAAIEKAVGARRFLDADDAKERLAERFFLARSTGKAFDADKEADLLSQRQETALKKHKIAWANEKTKAATATATPAASPSPPVGRAPDPGPPPWGSPERRKWNEEQAAATLTEFRS